MLWAWLMFGEPLSWAMAGGLVVSLIGILIVAKPQAPTIPDAA
jgi:drug/metabolite transporter (DMT)-like permease